MIGGEQSVLLSPIQSIPFCCGNPNIEETRGVIFLYSNAEGSRLPDERKPYVCVIGVPNHTTYADFFRFCASFIQHVLEMRVIRNDGSENNYSVLIRFDGQNSTDKFYHHFNGRKFSSLEEDACRVLFTVDIQFTGHGESSSSLDHHILSFPANATERPACPVCLERLDDAMGGIFTTICNHSFHCSCISKCTDSSCPVCRYFLQEPGKSLCFVCQTSENLSICVICGFVGCGRYEEEHAMKHWKDTQHCYSLELETQRVWDYVGGNYVHRLIQSKTDGKLVELNSQCLHSGDQCGACRCVNSCYSEALLNSKVEVIANEYSELLATQLENQKAYFETLLQKDREETEKIIAEAVQKAVRPKMQKMQAKFDRCVKEKKFLDDLNENLLKNLETWKAKMKEIENRHKTAMNDADVKIEHLETKLRTLMDCLESGNSVEQKSDPPVVELDAVLPISMECSSSANYSKGRKNATNLIKS